MQCKGVNIYTMDRGVLIRVGWDAGGSSAAAACLVAGSLDDGEEEQDRG